MASCLYNELRVAPEEHAYCHRNTPEHKDSQKKMTQVIYCTLFHFRTIMFYETIRGINVLWIQRYMRIVVNKKCKLIQVLGTFKQ